MRTVSVQNNGFNTDCPRKFRAKARERDFGVAFEKDEPHARLEKSSRQVAKTRLESKFTNHFQKQNFTSKWVQEQVGGFHVDTLFKTSVDCVKNGSGKEFFDVLKGFLKISPESKLQMSIDRSDYFDYCEYFEIKNLSSGKTFRRKLDSTTLYKREDYDKSKAFEILDIMKNILSRKSKYKKVREELFGKNTNLARLLPQKTVYKEIQNPFDYFFNNIQNNFIAR